MAINPNNTTDDEDAKDDDVVFDIEVGKEESEVLNYEDTPTPPSPPPSETAPSTSAPPSPSRQPTRKKDQSKELFHIETNRQQQMLPLAGIMLSSLVLLIAISSKGGPSRPSGYLIYGIVLSVVAILSAAVVAILLLRRGNIDKEEDQEDEDDQEEEAPKHQQSDKNPSAAYKPVQYLNYFLFLWSLVGACIMTFGNGPFVTTSNGYFAAWGMATFAGIQASFVISLDDESFKKLGSTNARIVHMISSIIVIVALASSTGNGGTSFFDISNSYRGVSIFGLILACLSVFLMTYDSIQSECSSDGNDDDSHRSSSSAAANIILSFPTMAAISGLWIVSASLLTFSGPFLTTGNGYFGVWGGAVSAIYVAMSLKEPAK